ncbi:MAG: glycosyltransferase family 39 protein [Anaerolineales bacterium]|nr:glycosyltransferase family 39 protein [Anaerolineales bacterium]
MNFRKILLVLLLLALTIAPRLSALDTFVTIDEPFWLSVGANYYYALGQRELENTVYEYHPAVTTMSFITAAFLVDFPDYRGLGQGYFDVDKEKFDPFIIENGHDPMVLLVLSRLFQVATIILFVLIIFYLLSVLFGDEKAFFITAFISSAPYFLGHSRVLSHEALVAFFVLASLLGMLAYLEFERKWFFLLISGASAALAQLTKSSAMAMFPVIALMLAIAIFEKTKERGLKSALLEHLKIFGVWLGWLALAYFILWPGMWAAPGKMLYEVYGNAFSYALQGSRLQVTQELEPSRFGLATMSGSILNFVAQVFTKETPFSWLGLILAVLSLRRKDAAFEKKLMLYLFVNAVMSILLFSAAQGRNSPHYIMSAHVSMDVIAALGWVSFSALILNQDARINSRLKMGGAVFILILQLGSALIYYPYYYTYHNPLVVNAPLSDYGEGFEQAAAYLAQKPNADSLKVLSFRGRGPFSYFFPGETIIFNPLFIEEPGMPSMIERLEQADYLVINDALRPRTPRSELFVQAMDGVTPEHSIFINGVSTIRIYRMADLPVSFYETISK